MLTYEEAKEMMQRARNGRRKLENNTWLEERGCLICAENFGRPGAKDYHLHQPQDECIDCKAPQDHHDFSPAYAVRLHETDVVTINHDGSYTLDSGGWRTVTTKDRINHYAPVALFSNRGQWMITGAKKALEPWDSYGGGFSWDFDAAVPFADGIRLYPDGRVTGAGIDETAIRAQLLKQIRAYIDGFAHHVVKHGLENPSGGDCWGCYMVPDGARAGSGRAPWGQDKATKPGEDHVMGLDHIFEHFREKYYVPSLAWRAMQRRGNPAFCYQLAQRDAENGRTDMLKRDLRAYFKSLMPALVAAKVAELESAS